MVKKTAIISGGLGGIGWAIFERLAHDGFTVAILANNLDKKKVKNYENKGHLFLQCDLTKAEDVVSAVRKVKDQYSRLDACIHCAVSPILRKKFLETSPKEFYGQFEVGLFGGFIFLQETAKIMKERQNGRIVGITSAVIEPNSGSGTKIGYVSSKYALRGLLREMARELAPMNITVNAVAPGFIRTELNQDIPGRVDEFVIEKNLFHKMPQPSDVAGVVSFLCSDDAVSITGLQIPVTYGEVITL